MRAFRGAVIVVISVAVSGCGFLMPEGTGPPVPAPAIDEGPAEFREPPEALINNVPGKPVSYCWVDGCADGFVNHPSILAAVTGPYRLTLPEGAEIAGVTAWRSLWPKQDAAEVPHTKTGFGRVPEGAIALSVFVYFEQGGDAAYYWALLPPDGPSPSGN